MSELKVKLMDAPAVLRSHIDRLSMTQSEFSMRMGVSSKHVCAVLEGESSITPVFALHCEYVLGIHARDLTVPQMREALANAPPCTLPATVWWCRRKKFPHRKPHLRPRKKKS